MKLSGHVRLHRKIREHPVWTQLSPAVHKFFDHCIMEANWKPETRYTGDAEIVLPVGSFVSSIRKMAAECNLSFRQIRDALEHLERLEIITTAPEGVRGRAHGETRVTVLHYERYQLPESDEGTRQGTREGTREGTRPSGVNDVEADTCSSEEKNRGTREGTRHGTARAQRGHSEGTPPPQKTGVNGNKSLKQNDGDLLDCTQLKEEDLNTYIYPPPKDVLIESVAQKIHDRHPAGRGCSLAVIKSKLKTVRKTEPEATRAVILDRIDACHAAWCATEEWKGKYAKGLENWLAPTMRRWEVWPAGATTSAAPRLPMVKL